MKKQLSQHDYYAILGVSKSASLGQIKHAYRQLAVKHHPDKSSNSERIVLINEAYATLKDPKKRAEYDVYHALYFSTIGKLSQKVAQKVSQTAQQSPAVMSHLKKLERHAITASHFAEYELRPLLLRNAKSLFIKLSDLMATHTMSSSSAQTAKQSTPPTLVIPSVIAKHGGQFHFTYHAQKIRTTLPKGLVDGSQIKLTIHGKAVWFVIKVE